MRNFSPLTHPAETLAEVRAHDQVMRYRRAGAGRPLIVLCGANHADALWPELHAHLASRFRVLTPELPADCGDVAAWVTDFLEGLGLDRVVVLAAEPCCLAALEFALLHTDQVDRLALVPAGSATETGLEGTIDTPLAGLPVPLIVVRRGLSSELALPLLRNFLEHDRHPSAVG